MLKNKFKRNYNSHGITLIALVITIIVLLILAGVSLRIVFDKDGLFKNANLATTKYSKEQAEEELILILMDAQMMKHEPEGLNDEKLDEKINEIGQVDKTDRNKVTVDDYIFQIDRSIPKIVECIGKADGIIIKYKIIGPGSWIKEGETNVSLNVTVQDNEGILKGETIRVSKDGEDITNTIMNAATGTFTLTTNTTTMFVINVENSKGEQSTPKTIKVNVKADGTIPTIEKVDVTSEGMDILIRAAGNDKDVNGQEQSGIKQFNYEITSTEDTNLAGIPKDKITGTFKLGETATITATKEATYIVKVTAEDNVGNISEEQTGTTKTIDGITVAKAKQLVNKDTLQQYIGKKVIDYTPKAGGVWKIYYYDDDGYFGEKKKLYLKMDNGPMQTLKCAPFTSDGISNLIKMNPKWKLTNNIDDISNDGKKCAAWLCESSNWTKFLQDDVADFIIGSSSWEMLEKSYNVYRNGSPDNGPLSCTVSSYGVYTCKSTESKCNYSGRKAI